MALFQCVFLNFSFKYASPSSRSSAVVTSSSVNPSCTIAKKPTSGLNPDDNRFPHLAAGSCARFPGASRDGKRIHYIQSP